MLDKSIGWLKGLSFVGKVMAITASAVVGGTLVSAVASKPTNAPSTKPSTLITTEVPKIETKNVAETRDIPFTSTTTDDNTASAGTLVTRTAGANGIETLTYVVTYIDGVETSRNFESSVITTEPIQEVIARGTYVAPVQEYCPNGTYTNTYGNEVCSPYSSPTIPTGASAQCVDGTYSFSQSRRGTCSYHGGVAEWY